MFFPLWKSACIRAEAFRGPRTSKVISCKRLTQFGHKYVSLLGLVQPQVIYGSAPTFLAAELWREVESYS